MRRAFTFAVLLAAFLAAPARADDLTLQAERPVVDVRINNQPARFLVDTALPDIVVLNAESARRLQVRILPAVKVRAVSDDVSITGRVALPVVVFANGKRSRATAGIFGGDYGPGGLDGAIGPGALPYDQVRIVLKSGPQGAVSRTFALRDAGVWQTRTAIGQAQGDLNFRLDRTETVLSRATTHLLDLAGALKPAGDIVTVAYPFGLSTKAQPVTSDMVVGGFHFGPTLARTAAPLVAPDGAEVTVIAQGKKKPDYRLTLGRAALAACTDMVWVKRAKTLTVLCDG